MAKILIVDDNDYTRLMLKGILVSGTHDVVEAKDGSEVMDAYEEHHPDIVMLDVVMPEKDGITAAKELVEKYPDAKIVIASAQQNSQLSESTEKIGVAGYVTKPFDSTKILELVDKTVG